MQPVTRVYLYDDNGNKFFGEGPYRLLRGVEDTGSLRASAMAMGMAYTKALRLLRTAEEALGYPLTQRAAGGHAGGGSRLTPQGRAFLDTYARFRDRCAEENRLLWQQEFSHQQPET